MALRKKQKDENWLEEGQQEMAAFDPVAAAASASAAAEGKGSKRGTVLLASGATVIVIVLAAFAYMQFGGGQPEVSVQAPPPVQAPPTNRVETASTAAQHSATNTAKPTGTVGTPLTAHLIATATAAESAKTKEAAAKYLKWKLKKLWDEGAEAKHDADFVRARARWQEILRLKPNHPGIQEALQKLDEEQKSRDAAGR